MKTDDRPIIRVATQHCRRITVWVADCSEHGMIPSDGTKKGVMGSVNLHAGVHRGDVHLEGRL